MKGWTVLTISSFILLCVTGCSLHRPQPVGLGISLPTTYAEAPATDTVETPTAKWWLRFADPQLSALIDEALRTNLDLTQAFARLLQLEAGMAQARAKRRPNLDFSAQRTRESSPSFAGDFTGSNESLSLAAGFEVDLWNKLKSIHSAAKLELTASAGDLQTLYLSISAEVADLYYLAVEQRAQLALNERAAGAATETLQLVETRYRRGLVSALDIYQARQNLAAIESSRPQFEANLAIAEHGLSLLLGRYPDGSDNGSLTELPPAPEAFPAGIPANLLSFRPDIMAALQRVKANDQRIAAAIADRFPSFNLLGNYGESSRDFSTGLIEGRIWSLTLNLLQPLYDGGRRKAEVARTRARFEESLALYRQTALAAFKEVEDALVNNRATESRITALQSLSNASDAALRLSLDNYLQGLSDYLPVLTAQQSDIDAASRLLTARRQLISDRISLARALGGSWMAEEQVKQRNDLNKTEDQ